MEEKRFSVWVGGIEVTDILVTRKRALEIKQEYIANGYDDVCIDEY